MTRKWICFTRVFKILRKTVWHNAKIAYFAGHRFAQKWSRLNLLPSNKKATDKIRLDFKKYPKSRAELSKTTK
jgi:hypothetical protein